MMEAIDTGSSSSSKPVTVFSKQPFALSESVRQRLGASSEQMAGIIGITLRTYQRRSQQGRLDDAESAKVEMLRTLLDLGERVHGSAEEAALWLTSPILSLQGARPIDLLNTVKGYERVKNKLLQIEYGTF